MKRETMIEKSKVLSPARYATKFVAPDFQAMIRAEAGAVPSGFTEAVQGGQIVSVYRSVGYCVCITCGKVLPWKNTGGSSSKLDTGHFVPSRRASILFEETNVAPQCVACNQYGGGKTSEYRIWMEAVRGIDEIERLERLRNTSRQFTREELVDMRIEYKARLKAAKEKMG